MAMALEGARAACAWLDEGRPDEALEILGAAPAAEDGVAKSIRLAAAGLIAERSGDSGEAERCFGRVYDYGVPLPALLRQGGRYFKGTGRYDKAYHCYSLLYNIDPRALDEFAAGLPDAELCRYAPWIVPRRLGGVRPLFYPLQSTKAALARLLGGEGAAMALAQLTELHPDWQLRTMRLVSLRDHARAHGLAYQELANPADVYLPPPTVCGRPPLDGLRARTRAFFFCVLADAVVSSKSNFLIADDRAVLDAEPDELEKLPVNLETDPIVVAAENGAVTVLVNGDTSGIPVFDQALSLVGVHSYAFGHWMLEFLPKLWACRQRPGFDAVPILIDEKMPPQHREALCFFIAPGHPVVTLQPQETVRVKRLWTCSTMCYSPVGPTKLATPGLYSFDTKALAALLASLDPKLEAIEGPPSPRHLYMTRKDSQHRRLINRERVESWLADRGFHVVDFDFLPFLEQLRLIRGADLILAADGSSLYMTFFAKPGKRIGVLGHQFLDLFVAYAEVFDHIGCRFAILAGDLVGENCSVVSDYTIDLDALAVFVDGLSGSAVSGSPASASSGIWRGD
jgi:hypothetical protein